MLKVIFFFLKLNSLIKIEKYFKCEWAELSVQKAADIWKVVEQQPRELFT